MNKYDVIIPLGPNEVRFIHRVYDYVWRCMKDVEHIYIITSSANFKRISKDIPLTIPVYLIDENSLVENLSFDRVRALLKKHVPKGKDSQVGWYLQQFLKLAFAYSDYANKHYVTWDADTLPLAPISFFEDEHLLFNPKYEYNYNYFKTMDKLLGYGRNVNYSFISESMIFSVEIVKEMLGRLSERAPEGQDWIEFIISLCDFTQTLPAFSEFETYGNFCSVNYPGLYKVRHLNTFREAGLIAGRSISESKLRMMSFDLDTASFERSHLPSFPYGMIQRYDLLLLRLKKLRKMTLEDIARKVKNKLNGKDILANQEISDVVYRLPKRKMLNNRGLRGGNFLLHHYAA